MKLAKAVATALVVVLCNASVLGVSAVTVVDRTGSSTDQHTRGAVQRSLATSTFVGQCMQDNWKAAGNNADLNCNAKEVTVQSTSVEMADASMTQCTAGERILIKTLSGEIKFNAERYDPGWYIGTEGQHAYTGQCALTTLGSYGISQGLYSLTNGGSVTMNEMEKSNKIAAGDLCGDVMIKGGKGTVLTTQLMVDTEVLCADANGDGDLDLSICFSWRVKGKDGMCDPKALFPGTPSKCDCERMELPAIKVVQPVTPEPTAAPTAAPTRAPAVAPTTDEPTAAPQESSLGPVDDYSDPLFQDDLPDTPALDAYIWNGTLNAGEKSCVQDIFWDFFVSEMTCAANQVTVAQVSAVDSPESCEAGEKITVTLRGDITMQSDLIDPGWYLATDGGDALTGFCQASSLNPEGDYTFDNSEASISFADDVCGDLVTEASGGPTTITTDIAVQTVILCADADDDGLLDFSICFAWKDATGQCLPSFPIPGESFDCDCQSSNVANVRVTQPVVVHPC